MIDIKDNINRKRIISMCTIILFMFLMITWTTGENSQNQLPDLTIIDLELTLPDTENTTTVYWNATIKNIGIAPATAFSVSFYYNEINSTAILIASPSVSGLSYDTATEVGVTWNVSSLHGDYQIVVEINKAQEVQESDYSNNVEIREGTVNLDSSDGPIKLGAMWNVARMPVIDEYRHFVIAPKGLGEDKGIESECICIEMSDDHCAYYIFYWLIPAKGPKISFGPHEVAEDERHPEGLGRWPEYLGPLWIRSSIPQVREIHMQVEINLEESPYYLTANHFITVAFV